MFLCPTTSIVFRISSEKLQAYCSTAGAVRRVAASNSITSSAATWKGNPGDVTLLYRVVDDDDAVFRDELRALAKARGIDFRLGVGGEIGDDQTDRLGIPALRAMVPDVRERDCFVCGPPGMLDAVCRRLGLLGVPNAQIHFERFEF